MTENRIAQARSALAAAGAEALLVTSLPSVFYLSGFSGSNAALLVFPDSLHLLTDSRYTLQAHEESPGALVHIVKKPLLEVAGSLLRGAAGRSGLRAALDPVHLNLVEGARLKQASGSRVRWKQAPGLVERLREIKSPEELAIMRRAAKVGSQVMAEAIDLVKPGVSELDLAAEIDYRMRQKGASGPSFDTIVASGPRTALPHAQPTAKRLQKNELVLFDSATIAVI